MKRRLRIGLAVALLIGLAFAAATALSGDPDDEAPPLAAFNDAIDRTATAAYSYVGDVRIRTDAGTMTLRIDGRVAAGSREVRVRAPDDTTTTFRLEDGEATIDFGDGPQPAPAGRSLDATSLDLLGQIDRVVKVSDERYEGTMRGDLLLEPLTPSAVVAADSDAFVAVDVDAAAKLLRGYTISEVRGAWRISIQFTDVRPAAGSP